jgi:hypothetical protein
MTKTIEDLQGGESLDQASEKTAEGLGELLSGSSESPREIRRTFDPAKLDALRKYDFRLKTL